MQPLAIPIPKNRPVWDGEIATYWFEDGILVSLSKSTLRTVESIRKNVTLVQEITGGKPVPLLIYLANSPVPDKATRKYSAEMLPVIYTAMAMVSRPGLARFIMRILFALKPPPIPMRQFNHAEEAKAWLKQFL
jgi:hypothetical protein